MFTDATIIVPLSSVFGRLRLSDDSLDTLTFDLRHHAEYQNFSVYRPKVGYKLSSDDQSDPSEFLSMALAAYAYNLSDSRVLANPIIRALFSVLDDCGINQTTIISAYDWELHDEELYIRVPPVTSVVARIIQRLVHVITNEHPMVNEQPVFDAVTFVVSTLIDQTVSLGMSWLMEGDKPPERKYWKQYDKLVQQNDADWEDKSVRGVFCNHLYSATVAYTGQVDKGVLNPDTAALLAIAEHIHMMAIHEKQHDLVFEFKDYTCVIGDKGNVARLLRSRTNIVITATSLINELNCLIAIED